jgi:predicted anti-sigma-YlaC factor YlaD
MDQHLDAKAISAFRRHELSGAPARAAAAHVESCPSCRGAAAGSAAATVMAAVLVDDSEHLPEDLIARYADQVVDDAERTLVQRHLEACSACGAEIADLLKFVERENVARINEHRHRQKRTPIWSLVAAACLALVIATVAINQRSETDSGPAAAVVPATNAATSTSSEPAATTPAILASVSDDGGRIVLLSNGDVRGADMTPEQSSLVRRALTDRTLPESAVLTSLATSVAALRGSASPQRLTLLQPVGSAVLDDAPAFRWQAVDGATSYKVAVSTEDFRIVAESPALATTTWTPQSTLPRGATYSWQVVAQTPNGEVVAPGVGGAEAKFHVVSAETRAALDSLSHQKSHLVRGLAYAKHGLLLDAEAELAKLAAADPKSPIAQSLLEQVRERLPRR